MICTEPFETSAKAQAQAQGMPDFPFALATHPIGSLDVGELQKKAQELLPQVLGLILRQK